MTVSIAQIREEDITGFHAALDDVARESGFLARDHAPPIAQTYDFVKNNIEAGHVQLVAHDSGTIVGWCDILPREGDAAVGTVGMGVVATHRGQGLGRRLLAEAIKAAAPKNFSVIRLDVQARNAGAIALYEKLGFAMTRAYERDGQLLHEMVLR